MVMGRSRIFVGSKIANPRIQHVSIQYQIFPPLINLTNEGQLKIEIIKCKCFISNTSHSRLFIGFIQITLVKLNSNTSLTTLLHLQFHYKFREIFFKITHNTSNNSVSYTLRNLESIIIKILVLLRYYPPCVSCIKT